ncbi:hypothetical protein N24_1947 [Corynebacterium suranareeae]|uniref:Uncharacterized protein n=1 Tax=Corynebacterium suranareeae TaxID=2506452 RepID=A0A160PQF0_9CORY|nr:hypothetical protein N24_1947 [Corynebacterium suranareeae]GAV97419.1 hypothetical protein CS176_1649 [Corynebacterium glutamicum]
MSLKQCNPYTLFRVEKRSVSSFIQLLSEFMLILSLYTFFRQVKV